MTASQQIEDHREDLRRLCDDILRDAAVRRANAGPEGPRLLLDRRAWADLRASGLIDVLFPESLGGGGGDLRDSAVVVASAARHSVAAPVAETVWMAAWLLQVAGLPAAQGCASVTVAAFDMTTSPSGLRLRGTAKRVPWAEDVDRLVVLGEAGDDTAIVVALDRDEYTVRPGQNLAREPRDAVAIDVVLAPGRWREVPASTRREFGRRATASVVVSLAVASRAVLDTALAHVAERRQFGRELGSFQAVQHLLAELAREALLLDVAADGAVDALVSGGRAGVIDPVGAAAVVAERAAGEVARVGHQLLGALGTTEEHPLRRSTTRLWAWREELAAGPHDMAVAVGADVLAHPGDWWWHEDVGETSRPLLSP